MSNHSTKKIIFHIISVKLHDKAGGEFFIEDTLEYQPQLAFIGELLAHLAVDRSIMLEHTQDQILMTKAALLPAFLG